MKKSEAVILVAILLTSMLLGASLLTRGHDWGDDFASYIMQAQSISKGATREFVQHNAFTIHESFYPLGPVAYPWGYPLLLAPVLAIFGLKILALKFVNTILYVFFLVVFYALARLRLPPTWCLLLTAVFAFNPALLEIQDNILSDIAFLFFSTLTIFLIERWLSAEARPPSILASGTIGAAVFAAFTIRTNGILLLGALGIAQLLFFWPFREIRKNLLIVLLPYLTFGALAAFQALLLPGGQESYFSHYAMLTPQLLSGNAIFYLHLPAEMFADVPLGILFSILGAALFLIGLFANPRKNAVFLTYILLTLALFITWPEAQGLRFLFPILPLLLLVAAEGWQFVSEKLSAEKRLITRWAGSGLAGALIVLSLSVSAQSAWVNLQNGRVINGPFDPVSAQMFEFVREHTPADSVIVFFKPRAMRLFTDRDAFATDSCNDFPKGDYVVLHEKQGSNMQVANPESCGDVSLSVVFNNLRFTVYQVNK